MNKKCIQLLAFTLLFAKLCVAQAITTAPIEAKNIAAFGSDFVDEEIAVIETEDTDGTLKFAFNGVPTQHLRKVVQIYCKVWDLKPGKYTLTIQAKSNLEELKFPISLSGKLSDGGELFKLAEYVAPGIGQEWGEISLNVTMPEGQTKHGYLDMRVGEVPTGAELYFKPTFTFTRK